MRYFPFHQERTSFSSPSPFFVEICAENEGERTEKSRSSEAGVELRSVQEAENTEAQIKQRESVSGFRGWWRVSAERVFLPSSVYPRLQTETQQRIVFTFLSGDKNLICGQTPWGLHVTLLARGTQLLQKGEYVIWYIYLFYLFNNKL
jgi:hypothetical protein